MSPFSLNQVEGCFYISEDEEKGESLVAVDDELDNSFEIDNTREGSDDDDDYTDGGELCQALELVFTLPMRMIPYRMTPIKLQSPSRKHVT